MRQLVAFLGSLLLNGGIIVGIIYLLDEINENPKDVITEAVSFDLGMMVSAQKAVATQPQQSQAAQAQSSVAQSEPEPEPKPEPKPIIKPIEKPKPITVKKPEPQKVQKKKIQKKKVKPKTVKKPKKKKAVKKVVKKKTQPRKKNTVKAPSNTAKNNVGIGIQQNNRVHNQGTQKPSQGGKGSSSKSNKANANAYRAGLTRAIARIAKRSHPRSARHMRQQGTAKVRFSLGRDGRISNISLVSSSGHSALDKAATKVMRRLGKYKAPPPGFPSVLTVPIRFNIK